MGVFSSICRNFPEIAPQKLTGEIWNGLETQKEQNNFLETPGQCYMYLEQSDSNKPFVFSSWIARQALDEVLTTSVLTEISSNFLVSERYSMKSKSRSI